MAILGSGLNIMYPPENRDLARQIVASGTLISEVHPDTNVTPSALRLRNRLITAFSCATIVIEAGATSGALHAARFAGQQGHPVFAAANSDGNVALLEHGAAHPLPDDPADVDALIDQIRQFAPP